MLVSGKNRNSAREKAWLQGLRMRARVAVVGGATSLINALLQLRAMDEVCKELDCVLVELMDCLEQLADLRKQCTKAISEVSHSREALWSSRAPGPSVGLLQPGQSSLLHGAAVCGPAAV